MSAAVLDALAVAVRADCPVLLWGSPGTGKTSAVLGLAAALGWPVEVVVGSLREPSDFAGLPVVTGQDVRFAPPGWARRLAGGGPGLLFLDELTTAPPAVQAAMLRVVLERHVGDLALPDTVRVVAAANPPEQAADGWDLSAPMANRLVHLDWTVDASAVAAGLAVGFPAPDAVLARPGATPEQELAARSVVAAFLSVRPALVLQVPSSSSDAGRAWPSPRSWETVATLLAGCEASAAGPDVRSLLVRGTVGDGPGLELLSWIGNLDLPDPAAVLADPDAFVLPDRGDRAFAALTAVASYAVVQGDVASWDAAWVVVARAAREAPDLAVLAARVLARRRPEGARLPEGLAAL
ncbi:MAG: family ATPase, partial [Frankiales bacterium]|nr:family ATPase [Frankiales bacterium]